MSLEVRTVVVLLHLVAMVFMAAPLYMLIIVNERARFAVPANYGTDRYLENVIKGQPSRCYAYMAVILVTGLLLMGDRGWPWGDWALLVKLGVFALLLGSLTTVHLYIQPKVDAVMAGIKPGQELDAKQRPLLMRWRMRRKRLAVACLFLVLVAVIMGLRVTLAYAPWLAAVFVALAALFSWRTYTTGVRWGWV